MVFSEEDHIAIKLLRQEKGYRARRLLTEFPGKQWTRSSLEKQLYKIDATGSVVRKPGSGQSRTVRTEAVILAVKDLALSQEMKPGTHKTVREIARDISFKKDDCLQYHQNGSETQVF